MRTAAIILTGTFALFGAQAAAYFISEGLGDVLAWAGIIWIAIAAWLIGARLDHRYVLVACLIGSLLGFAYWIADWQVLRLVRVEILHQFTGSQVNWLATGFWFLKWPLILVGGAAGGISSWKTRTSQ
jgi:hypothetical protein